MSNATAILHKAIPFNGVCSKDERSYLRSVYQSDSEMEAFVSVHVPTMLISSFWNPTPTGLSLHIRKFSNSSTPGWNTTRSI